MALTVRGKNQRWLSDHRGITEDPYGSNRDNRPNHEDGRWGITKAQQHVGGDWLIGTAWCGTWAAWALQHAGVQGVTSRLASVALIEQDARARRAPFRDWLAPADWGQVLRGDLVVLFGFGVHVGTVRGFKRVNGTVYVITDEGNTSGGPGGSQSNGGGSFRRERPLSDVHGFARVDYPGGAVVRRLSRVAAAVSVARVKVDATPLTAIGVPKSDLILWEQIKAKPEATDLLDAMLPF